MGTQWAASSPSCREADGRPQNQEWAAKVAQPRTIREPEFGGGLLHRKVDHHKFLSATCILRSVPWMASHSLQTPSRPSKGISGEAKAQGGLTHCPTSERNLASDTVALDSC